MARILIVGGGCRGRRLASELAEQGHALRITSRREAGRTAIEAAGAECWIGTPERLDTLREALENVTLVCWLFAAASGSEHELRELYGPRLEAFVRQLIDTTARGFIYEPPGTALPAEAAAKAAGVVRAICERNAIPFALLRVDPAEADAWISAARAAVAQMLGN